MAKVLVVDDSQTDRQTIGALLEAARDLEVQYAVDGADALAKMQQTLPDLVVTDLMMPRMDGLELVGTVTERYPLVPVILTTAQGNEETAIQALQRGAASYVPKRRLADNLLDTVREVLRFSQRKRSETQLMGCMTRHEGRFVLDNDPGLIEALVTYLQEEAAQFRFCDEVEGRRLGVALEEALKNALFHGNLELERKLREQDKEAYDALVTRRREQPPYRDRRIHVDAKLSPDGATFVIRDEGLGFDTSSLPDPAKPASLEKTSARGVLLMRALMDEVVFNESGNAVTLVKRRRGQQPAGNVKPET
jgi:CheY-like chemotaxis protein/anti-sigma regulatory factor (Ser/Thr protein kinase)